MLKKGKKDARTIVADAIQFYHDYVAYAINDTDICYAAFRYLLPLLPAMELKYHQIMIRCYTDPVLKLNADVLLKEMKRLQKRRLDKVRPVADAYYGGNIEEAKKALSSKALFAVLLKSMGGVEDYEVYDAQARDEQVDYAFLIPTKVSEKTGKHDYAFALTDTAFVELANVSPELKTVLDARKEVASSLEFSRTERFLSSCKWEKTFGLPYKISGAATHRASGAMSLNVQNLSSGRKEGQTTALRDSMCAPAGFKIMAVDSSQVEARILAFVSGCIRQLEVFSSGADFYSSIGEAIYNEPAAHINAMRKAGDAEYIYKRSVAKSCGLGLGYGMGAEAFVDAAFVLAGVVIDLVRSKELKQIYETNYPEIKQFWNTCNKVIDHMLSGGSGTFGGPDGKLFYYDGNYQIHGSTVPSIIMPSGMRLSYYKLCRRKKSYADGSERDNYAYWGLKEGRYQWVYLWGSKLTENLCQALAFDMMKYQGVKMAEQLKIVLNTHDEWGVVVKEDDVPAARQFAEKCMREVPSWLEGLVVECGRRQLWRMLMTSYDFTNYKYFIIYETKYLIKTYGTNSFAAVVLKLLQCLLLRRSVVNFGLVPRNKKVAFE